MRMFGQYVCWFICWYVSNHRHIKRVFKRLNVKEWLGGNTEIHAEIVHNVRNWSVWFDRLGIQMSGGFIGEGSLHAWL